MYRKKHKDKAQESKHEAIVGASGSLRDTPNHKASLGNASEESEAAVQPGAVPIPGPVAHTSPHNSRIFSNADTSWGLTEEFHRSHFDGGVDEEQGESSLASANEVMHIPEAILVSNTSSTKENGCSFCHKPRLLLTLFGVVIIVVVAVVTAVTLNAGGGVNENPETPSQTQPPEIQPPQTQPPQINAAVTVVIQLDKNPAETGWSLMCGDTVNVTFPPGTYKNRVKERISVQQEVQNVGDECMFTITDAGDDGLDGGYFAVHFNEETTDTCAFLVDGREDFGSEANYTFSVVDKRAPTSFAASVRDADGYRLVYNLDIPTMADFNSMQPDYNPDFHLCEAGFERFDRVAYYIELKSTLFDRQWLWVSMDAFADDIRKTGVPTFKSEAVFQKQVAGMNVHSNVEGLRRDILVGRIEFWPTNYGPTNSEVPGEDNNAFDFGDAPTGDGSHGSMQIHALTLNGGETLFAYNMWNNGRLGELGIGDNPDGHPDWTFANNTDIYTTKFLMVFVK